MKKIYIFSGLGVDERVFKNMDFSGFEPVFIHWIAPLKKESIESYSKRLTDQIVTEKPVLIGLSFGGMIAIEVAKHIETEKIILLASAKTKYEVPFYFRLGGLFRIQKLIPFWFLNQANFVTYWFFETHKKSEKDLLKNILADTDPGFLKWALDKIVYWKNEEFPKNLIHIHGSKDRVLPAYFISSDIKVDGAGHFFTVSRARTVSRILMEFLEK